MLGRCGRRQLGLAMRAVLAKGRKVLIPASMWPDESCDEFEGEGWSAVLGTESRGVVGVKAVGYSCFYFQVEEVLKWRPLK